MTQKANINLSLTEEEVNLVLAALGKLSFEQVISLVMKIKNQGDQQIQARLAEEIPQE